LRAAGVCFRNDVSAVSAASAYLRGGEVSRVWRIVGGEWGWSPILSTLCMCTWGWRGRGEELGSVPHPPPPPAPTARGMGNGGGGTPRRPVGRPAAHHTDRADGGGGTPLNIRHRVVRRVSSEREGKDGFRLWVRFPLGHTLVFYSVFPVVRRNALAFGVTSRSCESRS